MRWQSIRDLSTMSLSAQALVHNVAIINCTPCDEALLEPSGGDYNDLFIKQYLCPEANALTRCGRSNLGEM